MRYQYIRDHREEFSIKRMCQLLGVTRSGYYAWQGDKAGPRELENQVPVNISERNIKPAAKPMAVRASGLPC